ncbi:MAG: hypothetical protein ACLF0G_09425 [Candidatus Brocadiia bacterium]
MSKLVVMAVAMALALGALPVSQAQAAEPKAGAPALSVAFPGTGEWLNRDFEGQFPALECLLGCICPVFRLTSALDAAAGDQSPKIRWDFWSKPVPEK